MEFLLKAPQPTVLARASVSLSVEIQIRSGYFDIGHLSRSTKLLLGYMAETAAVANIPIVLRGHLK